MYQFGKPRVRYAGPIESVFDYLPDIDFVYIFKSCHSAKSFVGYGNHRCQTALLRNCNFSFLASGVLRQFVLTAK